MPNPIRPFNRPAFENPANAGSVLSTAEALELLNTRVQTGRLRPCMKQVAPCRAFGQLPSKVVMLDV